MSEHDEIETETEEPQTIRTAARFEYETPEDLISLVEAVIFANGEPISAGRISEITKVDETHVRETVELAKAKYRETNFGFELVEVGEQFQFRTKAGFAEILRALKDDKPRRLSIAALETLAIIAYRQPIVRSDIERIRGVDATPTLKTLLDRGLIKIAGHQNTVGQPALYGTTEEFLKLFGIRSLGELPTLRDLTELDRDPGESGEISPELPPREEEEGSSEDLPTE